jgi:hypothetical protein
MDLYFHCFASKKQVRESYRKAVDFEPPIR